MLQRSDNIFYGARIDYTHDTGRVDVSPRISAKYELGSAPRKTTLKGAFDAINRGTHQGTITIGISGNTTETAPAVINASGSGGGADAAARVSDPHADVREASATSAPAAGRNE